MRVVVERLRGHLPPRQLILDPLPYPTLALQAKIGSRATRTRGADVPATLTA